MSETSSPHRVLHLVVEGFPAERRKELESSLAGTKDAVEIFELTGLNAREALEKIFAAETIAVWGRL